MHEPVRLSSKDGVLGRRRTAGTSSGRSPRFSFADLPADDDHDEDANPRLAEFPSTSWERRYRGSVIASDVFATLLVVSLGWLLIGRIGPNAGLVPGIMAVAFVLSAVPGSRAWHPSVLGEGAEEFRRLGKGVFSAGVLLALAGLLFDALAIRPWVFVVIPLIGLVALVQRYALRKWLHWARRNGRCLLPLMAAGDPEAVRDLIIRTRDEAHVGWQVEAVCTPSGRGPAGDGTEVAGVPVVGRLDELADHVRRGGYRMVAITADPYWTPNRLQKLAWDLEGAAAEMVVAPMLMEVAGPRLQVSGVFGMPLLRVSAPAFTGARRIVKEVVDRIGSAVLLTLLAPILVTIALAIKITDRGPVIYRQRRIGREGNAFTMLKFRTMVVNADAGRTELATVNEGAGPLFKLRADPRVTRVGGLLRRYSLDELPQLFNVLTGTMSLVGPRPPLPEETRGYGRYVRRRLLVKPGLTGLWQVSGRSDLSWAESVRLDLRYVEDWSLALDAVILWKTVRAVVTGNGAY
ncbi:MAG: exopolysaccharide biosynthesis polyprenyl glycosylphosphotransferase [Pseudonocardiaceae bacterium]|nr:exopolysaccharide biosynthesis polyprenyl glycosylphosphotransferase [Pseudonocardiaceae bacterium]